MPRACLKGKVSHRSIRSSRYWISIVLLTLLALTEHIGFLAGYVLAALILTAMNTTYVWFITRTASITLTIGTFLAILYGALYFILQLDDYAMLAGVTLLLALLGALMFATKNLQTTRTRFIGDFGICFGIRNGLFARLVIV